MTTRKELTEALRARYRSAAFGDRIKILNEFVALTGYHRKHAIRVLGEEAAGARAAPVRNHLYDEAVRQALTMLWEAADRVCGKRLKALILIQSAKLNRHDPYAYLKDELQRLPTHKNSQIAELLSHRSQPALA